MTNINRSRLIEILLCASDTKSGGLAHVAISLHGSTHAELIGVAISQRMAAGQDDNSNLDDQYYEQSCVEAAYRLIESDPTLRREWFGK